MFKLEEVSIGAWLLFMLVMTVPIVNIIVMMVLIFSSETNRTMKNYLIASLVPIAFGFIFAFSILSSLLYLL